jgi:hypothetical protein
MAYPFTPAQIEAFRAALATLAEGIKQGDRANADEKFIGLMRGIEQKSADVDLAPNIPLVAPPKEIGKSKPKGIFARFNWFSKNTEAKIPPKTKESSIADAGQETPSAAAYDPAKEVVFSSSDTRIVGSFFAGLPWALKKTADYNGSFISADTRIVSSFFPGLPWVSKANEKKIETIVESTLPAIKSATSFFSELPWLAKKNQGVAVEAEPVQALTDLPIKTITIDRIGKAKAPISSQVEVVSTAKDYFFSLPWVQPNSLAASDQTTNIGLSPSSQEMQFESVSNVGSTKSLDGYFQSLPWQGKSGAEKTDFISISTQGDTERPSIFAAATQSALRAAEKAQVTNVESGYKKMDEFFSSLPWRGSR